MRTAEAYAPGTIVAAAPDDVRSAFIRRTYAHLAGAVLVFAALEWVLLVPLRETSEKLIFAMLGTRFSWLFVLGAFMLVGWIADKWARTAVSPAKQYAGLALYVVAEAIIFLPLLYAAAVLTGDPNLIPTAGIMTLGMFGGLTLIVFVTRKDFSWMRSILVIAGFVAMGLIVCSILFGFELGTIFSAAMIALASGYILYYTSNVMHHYRTDQHVAAALTLFAAVALLFYYILRLLMQLRR
jgi:hypothetical protein